MADLGLGIRRNHIKHHKVHWKMKHGLLNNALQVQIDSTVASPSSGLMHEVYSEVCREWSRVWTWWHCRRQTRLSAHPQGVEQSCPPSWKFRFNGINVGLWDRIKWLNNDVSQLNCQNGCLVIMSRRTVHRLPSNTWIYKQPDWN